MCSTIPSKRSGFASLSITGLTGFACVIVYRRQLLKSVRNFVLMGAMPALGGATMVFLLVESCLSLARKGAPVGLRDRAAARDRFGKPCHRHHLDVCRQEGFARLLPAQGSRNGLKLIRGFPVCGAFG